MSETTDQLYALSSPCRLCPRECGAARREAEPGFCQAGDGAVVASVGPHYGEERPLVGGGGGGSGTIFFRGCNLRCAFCQNWELSHEAGGSPASPADLAEMMLSLERRGCPNVNFVTPTHFAAPLAEAITLARERVLKVPIVYNCGGYEKAGTLRLLAGLVEIYMPDFKFMDPELSARYLQARDYPEAAREAFREMHLQVGDLEIKGGIARRGLLVRHLVMPGGVEDSRRVIDFLAEEISPHTYVNVMGQYRPCHRAGQFREIDRRPLPNEIEAARAYARERGLRLDER